MIPFISTNQPPCFQIKLPSTGGDKCIKHLFTQALRKSYSHRKLLEMDDSQKHSFNEFHKVSVPSSVMRLYWYLIVHVFELQGCWQNFGFVSIPIITYLCKFRGRPKHRVSTLHCWTTSRASGPAPEARFILKFISLAQVDSSPVSLAVQNRGLKYPSFTLQMANFTMN